MSDGRLRVLALVPDAFGGRGGIALYLSDLLQATASLDSVNEVVVLARNPMRADAVFPGKVVNCEAPRGKVGWIRILLTLLARDRNFDLIICGHINFLPMALFAKSSTEAKLMLMIYGIDAWKPVGGRLGKWFLKQRLQVVSISEHTRELFCRWSGLRASEVGILPNVNHAERYGMAPPDEALKARYNIEGKRILLTLGRLSAQERYKGVDETLGILSELVRDVPDLVYVVAGDGDDRERLEQLVEDCQLGAFVRFTGVIAEREKAAHFQMADAFAMPGRGEGFGFVFLEAMACGLPVVASKLDGSREAVRNGDIGFMADPDNQNELKETILRALEEPKQIPDGLDYFSFENFISRLRAIYVGMGLMQA